MNELINVQIETKDGINVVSSRVIAKELGKEHSKVKRTLKTLLEQTPDVASDIFISEYNDRGRMLEEYLLTKDGFILYMFNTQGYNEFKIAYINEFNRMEKQLKEISTQEQLKANLLLSIYNGGQEGIVASKQLVELETKPLLKQIEEQKPLVSFATQVTNSSDCIDIGQFAKVLKDENIKIGRNKLFSWLRENKYLMNNNEPYQKFIDNGYFTVVEVTKQTAYGVKIYTKTLITGKGQIYILEKLRG